jgi:hypothetical protein
MDCVTFLNVQWLHKGHFEHCSKYINEWHVLKVVGS